MKEKIICAAIHYRDGKQYNNQPPNIKSGIVIGGHRHANCISLFAALLPYLNYKNDPKEDKTRLHFLNNSTQGFLTSKGNFVDRENGMKIAIAAGQVPFDNTTSILYSEDIY